MENPLDKLQSFDKADVGAAGLGFGFGFAIDVFLFPLGVPPGTTAGVFATASVGAKNIIGAYLERRKENETQAQRVSSHQHAEWEASEKLVRKVQVLMKHPDVSNLDRKRLQVELDLFTEELVDASTIELLILDIVASLRTRGRGPSLSRTASN